MVRALEKLANHEVGEVGGRLPDDLRDNAMSDPRALLRRMFDAAIAAAQPAHNVPPHLPTAAPVGRLVVIGAGKASAAMARAVEDHWAGELSGLVVTRYGYACRAGGSRSPKQRIRCPMRPGWPRRSACSNWCAASLPTISCCA
jgi:hypothetical protein